VSTSKQTIAFIEDQLDGMTVRTAAMFGEYGIYCDGKVVGLICNDTLYIKPSDIDPALIEGTLPAPPYTGAKDYWCVPGDLLENREWLQGAIQATADALPAPKPKKPKSPRTGPTAG
jgi:TfoX/Sxy family transcriptional regulator of competence genes